MKKRIAALLFAGILALAPAGGTAFNPTGGGYLADGKRGLYPKRTDDAVDRRRKCVKRRILDNEPGRQVGYRQRNKLERPL